MYRTGPAKTDLKNLMVNLNIILFRMWVLKNGNVYHYAYTPLNFRNIGMLRAHFHLIVDQNQHFHSMTSDRGHTPGLTDLMTARRSL